MTVVQTSGAAERAGRLAAFDGRPLPIVIRGLENGKPVERTEHTPAWSRPLHGGRLGRGRADLRRGGGHVISNTGDSGYRCPRTRRSATAAGIVPGQAHPAAAARWRAAAQPITLFPTELVTDNGVVLPGSAPGSPAAPACRGLRRAGSRRLRLGQQPGRPHRLQRAGAGRRGGRALCALGDRDAAAATCRSPTRRQAGRRLGDGAAEALHPQSRPYLPRRALAGRRAGRRTRRSAKCRRSGDPRLARRTSTTRRSCRSSPPPASRKRRPTAQSVIERFLNPFLDHRLADIIDNHRDKKERRTAG